MTKNKIKDQELSEEVQQKMNESVEEKVEETRDFLQSVFSTKNFLAIWWLETCRLRPLSSFWGCYTSPIDIWQNERCGLLTD